MQSLNGRNEAVSPANNFRLEAQWGSYASMLTRPCFTTPPSITFPTHDSVCGVNHFLVLTSPHKFPFPPSPSFTLAPRPRSSPFTHRPNPRIWIRLSHHIRGNFPNFPTSLAVTSATLPAAYHFLPYHVHGTPGEVVNGVRVTVSAYVPRNCLVELVATSKEAAEQAFGKACRSQMASLENLGMRKGERGWDERGSAGTVGW